MKKENPRIRIGRPLDPRILEMTEAYDTFPHGPSNFDPLNNWELTYRIYGIHGYNAHPRSGNVTLGFLRIARETLQDNHIQLRITQHSIGDTGSAHQLSCQMKCRNDRLSTPVSWQTFNKFFDYEGNERLNMRYSENGKLEKNQVHIRKNNKVYQFDVRDRVTSDWSLFDAIQRMEMRENLNESFDLLFGLSVLRPDHILSYRGKYPYKNNDKMREFHLLHEMGHGMLPYEYYLDSSNCLLAIFTMDVVYFYDEKAEDAFKERLEKERYVTRGEGVS